MANSCFSYFSFAATHITAASFTEDNTWTLTYWCTFQFSWMLQMATEQLPFVESLQLSQRKQQSTIRWAREVQKWVPWGASQLKTEAARPWRGGSPHVQTCTSLRQSRNTWGDRQASITPSASWQPLTIPPPPETARSQGWYPQRNRSGASCWGNHDNTAVKHQLTTLLTAVFFKKKCSHFLLAFSVFFTRALFVYFVGAALKVPLWNSDAHVYFTFLFFYTMLSGYSDLEPLCSCVLRFFERKDTHRAAQECLTKTGLLLLDGHWYSAGTRSQCSPQQRDEGSSSTSSSSAWQSRTLWLSSLSLTPIPPAWPQTWTVLYVFCTLWKHFRCAWFTMTLRGFYGGVYFKRLLALRWHLEKKKKQKHQITEAQLVSESKKCHLIPGWVCTA